MTKEKMLEGIDFLVKDEKEALEGYHEWLIKFNESPMIVDRLKEVYEDEARHLVILAEIKKAIEGHEDFVARAQRDKLFGMMSVPECCCDDGIVVSEDKKEKD